MDTHYKPIHFLPLHDLHQSDESDESDGDDERNSYYTYYFYIILSFLHFVIYTSTSLLLYNAVRLFLLNQYCWAVNLTLIIIYVV